MPSGQGRLNERRAGCGVALTERRHQFFGRRQNPMRDVAVVVAVASAMVVPWLAYCQWASGNPMPQSDDTR